MWSALRPADFSFQGEPCTHLQLGGLGGVTGKKRNRPGIEPVVLGTAAKCATLTTRRPRLRAAWRVGFDKIYPLLRITAAPLYSTIHLAASSDDLDRENRKKNLHLQRTLPPPPADQTFLFPSPPRLMPATSRHPPVRPRTARARRLKLKGPVAVAPYVTVRKEPVPTSVSM